MTSSYTVTDLSESLKRSMLLSPPVSVVKAWGYSPEGHGSWTGGFVLRLQSGLYAYLSGWCDTTGWGCQDGVSLTYAASIDRLGLPRGIEGDYDYKERKYRVEPIEWDEDPADLNRWIAGGMRDPWEL